MSSDSEGQLRQAQKTIEKYERILRSAAPRLAALKRLEEIAHEQNSSPEAVAADASRVMLAHQCDALEAEITKRGLDRTALDKELSMLKQSKHEVARKLADLRQEHKSLHLQITEAQDELILLRRDTDRLQAEREALESCVADLRGEQQHLGREEVTVHQRRRDDPGFTIDDGDADQRFDAFFHADVGRDKAREWMLG